MPDTNQQGYNFLGRVCYHLVCSAGTRYWNNDVAAAYEIVSALRQDVEPECITQNRGKLPCLIPIP